MNPLGIIADPDLIATLRRVAGSRDLASIDMQCTDDMLAVTRTWPKRWTTGFTPPSRLRPADLLVLRSIACELDTRRHAEDGTRTALDGVGTLARLAVDARPYWVPGSIIAGLARTDMPAEGADAIRLPATTVGVWFGSPIHPSGDITPQWMTEQHIPVGDDGRMEVPTATPSEWVAAMTIRPTDAAVDVQTLHGAILLSDDDGRPLDAMVWVVGTLLLGGERDGGWIFTLVPARPSLSGHRSLWWSMCALVAWGDWLDERPVTIHNRHKLRRLMSVGIDPSKLGPVRVMDARSRTGERPAAEPTSTHASPATHLRRGHWRRHRHGKGRSEVKLIWVAPTVVNPGHEGDWRETVWTLPPPESIPDTPTPNMFRDLD